MITSFIRWAKDFQESPAGRRVKAQVMENPTSDNPSARLDIDTPSAVARITCWESGDYDAEILDIYTEKTLYWEQGVIEGENVFSEAFAPFFKALEMTV